VPEEGADVRAAVEAEVADETDAPTGDEPDGKQADQQKRQATVCAQIKTMASVKAKDFPDICKAAGIDLAGGEAWEMAPFEKQLAVHDALSKALCSLPPEIIRGKKGGAK
jgi:hypothetical protein